MKYKLVPLEPTPEMEAAYKNGDGTHVGLYRAMIEAAPSAPVELEPVGEIYNLGPAKYCVKFVTIPPALGTKLYALPPDAAAVIAELEKERDKLILAVADNATARCELAAQNVAFREALSWAERNMDAETLVQFASEDDCHCPFCNVADFPDLASEVLKRRDAEIDLAADRLEVLEREHAEFFDRWHGERRMREKLVDDVERCYRMLLSEPDTKGALFKAENILREALAEANAKTNNALAQGPGGSSPGPAGATGYTSGEINAKYFEKCLDFNLIDD